MVARPNSKLLRVLSLIATVLFASTAFLSLMATPLQPVQAQLDNQEPASGPLPPGVTVDEVVNTTACLVLTPNPVGIYQILLVNMLVTPGPGANRYLSGYNITITKPDGSTQVHSTNSYLGNGEAWFEYICDTIGTWKFKFDFEGMYFPSGRYYMGRINSGSLGTLYSKSVYYTPAAGSEITINVQQAPVPDATLQISPSSGPGGAFVNLTGSGYPASAPIVFSYCDYNWGSGTWEHWTNVTSDHSGSFAILTESPDLQRSLSAGDMLEDFSHLDIKAEINGTAYKYGWYTEYYRGLNRVGNCVSVSGLFGDNTNLVSYVNAKAGDNVVISGKWFHPGLIHIKWDGTQLMPPLSKDQWHNAMIIGTSTANSTGSFETTVTIPNATEGMHYIAVEDSQAILTVKIYSRPLITTSPPSESTSPATNKPELEPEVIPPSPPTPTIDLSCIGTTIYGDFKVQISGKLSSNETALSGESILLSYCETTGGSWENLTFVKTDSDGGFKAVWAPPITRNYLVRAEYEGNSEWNNSSTIINLALVSDAKKNVFSVTSNSTVSGVAFNSLTKELSFTALGTSGSTGYVSICLEKALINNINDLQILVDEKSVNYTTNSQLDSWVVYFSYSHSVHAIVVMLGSTSYAVESTSMEPWLIYGVIIAVPVAVLVTGIGFLKKHKTPRNKAENNA
jgi:hypothetical protein